MKERNELLEGLALLPWGITIGGPILVLGYQGWLWLQSGVWPHFTFLTLLLKIFPNFLGIPWISYPNSWIGLHTVVMRVLDTPLALMVCFIGGIGGWIFILLCKFILEDRPKWKENGKT